LLSSLLTLGQVPAFAASQAPASDTASAPTADALAPALASLQMQFEGDAVHTNLSLAAPPKVGKVGDGITQVSFVAAAPLDLSRSGRLLHAREYYLVSTDGAPAVASTQEVHVDVNLETRHVDVTTTIGFHEAFDGRAGRPSVQGLTIENVVEIPLEEYRQAANAPMPQQAFQELTRRLAARESEVSHTTVTMPDGRRSSFRGAGMTLGQAVDGAVRGNIGPKVSFGCVKRCFLEVNERISLPKAICIAAVVVGCGASCFFVGPACIECFQIGFLGCSIGVGVVEIVRIIQCLLHC
jgi:hypothetical protein